MVAADNRPPKKSVRMTPMREAIAPPAKAPTNVMIKPKTLLTAATSSLEKPKSA